MREKNHDEDQEKNAHHQIRVRVPGKVNLFLQVGDLMPDGYHDVATVYQSLSLYENITVEPSDSVCVRFTGPIDSSQLDTGATNLAYKAAKMLARKTHVKLGANITIEKHIPIAAGMGGGSADAAGVLLACDALWKTSLPHHDLVQLAARLGADVPFALFGGTAVGMNRGERLTPVLVRGQFHWVLAFSEQKLPTCDVYNQLDVRREHTRVHKNAELRKVHVDERIFQALRQGNVEVLAACLKNDLQQPAIDLYPPLDKLLRWGLSNGALAGIVSGSGATVAFLVRDIQNAKELTLTLNASGMYAKHVVGSVPGARILDS